MPHIKTRLLFAAQALAGSALVFSSPVWAAKFRSGAYDNYFDPDTSVCVSEANIAALTPDSWLKLMRKRGKDCKVTQASSPVPLMQSWSANCTDKNGKRLSYKFSVSAFGDEKLTIDSYIKDAEGNDVSKRGLLGQRVGACASDTPAFSMWTYFDEPDLRAAQAVFGDLTYCGTLYAYVATRVKEPKRSELNGLSESYFSAAVSLLPNDKKFINDEMLRISTQLATEMAGSSAEKIAELVKSPMCLSYSGDGAIERVLKKKEVELGGL